MAEMFINALVAGLVVCACCCAVIAAFNAVFRTKGRARLAGSISIGIAIFLGGLSPLAIAQQLESHLTVTPTSCVSRYGDDPSLTWAQPGLDESSWLSSLPSPRAALPESPYHWRRCQINLRALARTGPVFLQIEELAAWQAYIDGQLVASFGDLKSGQYTMDVVQRFAIPKELADRGTILLAIRETQRGVPQLSYTPVVNPVSAGVRKTLADETAQALLIQFSDRIVQFTCYGFVGTAGVFFLILSRIDRTRRDLFWLALNCIGLGMLRANELAQVFLVHYPVWLQGSILGVGQWTLLAYLAFFFSLVDRKIPLLLRLNGVCLVLLLSTTGLPARLASPRFDQMAMWWGFFNPTMRTWHGIFGMINAMAPIFAFWPLWRVRKDLRVVCWVSLLWASGEFVNFAYRLSIFDRLDPTGIGREYRAIVTVPAVIAMFVLLARRQRRIAEERAELQGEMQAAQEVQRLLVPELLDLAPNIQIEVAYHPAKEVGGDFYFIRKTAAGQLVVLGDVSGKGLRAAMMASTVVGALRNEESTSPAVILGRLNEVVVSANFGGFVTCLCVIFMKGNIMKFANAGQILPYLEGKELYAENGLPLGLVKGLTYEESIIQDLGGQVTLLSDGVLEAQSPTGELFGFERMAAISSGSAKSISQAAQTWGQEDDITVLTVTCNSGHAAGIHA